MDNTTTHTTEAVVTESMLAQTVGSGDMPVLATPAMMALMENAAMLAVGSLLPEGSTSVGAQISCSHLHPTPLGGTVRATATLAKQEGRRLEFDIKAEDEQGLISEGTHTRYVVDRERFLGKLSK